MTTDKPGNGLREYEVSALSHGLPGSPYLVYTKFEVDALLAAKQEHIEWLRRCLEVAQEMHKSKDAEIARLTTERREWVDMTADAKMQTAALQPLAEIGRLAVEERRLLDRGGNLEQMEETGGVSVELDAKIVAYLAAQRETEVTP